MPITGLALRLNESVEVIARLNETADGAHARMADGDVRLANEALKPPLLPGDRLGGGDLPASSAARITAWGWPDRTQGGASSRGVASVPVIIATKAGQVQ